MSYSRHFPRHTPTPKFEVENGEARFEALLSKPLTDRDREFMSSLRDQLTTRGTLSKKQIDCLVSSEQKYSDEAIAARSAWIELYRASYRETMLICARYYVTTHYFRDLALRVTTDEDFVPTRRQYNAMCKNKYAEKAIKAATEEPLFPVGSLCKVRKNGGAARRHHNELALVVATHPEGLYPSTTVVVNGETIKYDQRLLKRHTRKRK